MDELHLDGGDDFTRSDEPAPAVGAHQASAGDGYEAPEPDLIEWSPERASFIVRGLGSLLHTLDPVARVRPPDHMTTTELGFGVCPCDSCQLWRMTDADAMAAGVPLARILNRYQPARAVAGKADELELGMSMAGYIRANLQARGRLSLLNEQGAAEPKLRETRPDRSREREREQGSASDALVGMDGAQFPPPPIEDGSIG